MHAAMMHCRDVGNKFRLRQLASTRLGDGQSEVFARRPSGAAVSRKRRRGVGQLGQSPGLAGWRTTASEGWKKCSESAETVEFAGWTADSSGLAAGEPFVGASAPRACHRA